MTLADPNSKVPLRILSTNTLTHYTLPTWFFCALLELGKQYNCTPHWSDLSNDHILILTPKSSLELAKFFEAVAQNTSLEENAELYGAALGLAPVLKDGGVIIIAG